MPDVSLKERLAMMSCVLLEVVTRNIIHIPTPWAEESSRFFCVWTVLFSGPSHNLFLIDSIYHNK